MIIMILYYVMLNVKQRETAAVAGHNPVLLRPSWQLGHTTPAFALFPQTKVTRGSILHSFSQ